MHTHAMGGLKGGGGELKKKVHYGVFTMKGATTTAAHERKKKQEQTLFIDMRRDNGT